MKIWKYSLLFLLPFFFSTGCDFRAKVGGKVTFPDGTPLTVGKVVFEDEKHTYSGTLQEGGRYALGIYRDGDGIPRGKYNVGIVNAVEKEINGDEIIYHPLVAYEFRASERSGIEYDVQKSMTIDIVVQKPDGER